MSAAIAIVRRAFSRRWLDRVLPALFFVSLAVTCFIGGAYVAEFDLPWYQSVLQPSFRGLRAIDEENGTNQKRFSWYPARDERVGTTVYEPTSAYNGLTLYTSAADSSGARLISMTGEVVHRWVLPFRQAWQDASHVPTPKPDQQVYWFGMRLFPNGDLLVNYVGVPDTPSGYGLAKIDKDSRLVWRSSDCIHHDFDLDGNGQIYALSHSIEKERADAAPHLRTPMLADSVVVLSPEGEELQRVAIFDAFAKSKFRDYLESMESDRKGDHTHTNAVKVISEAFAKKHKFCSAGDLMISLRNPSLLAILNLQREEIIWATHGIWAQQHDPDPLDNGNVLLFDNRGKRGGGGKSRILEWNPVTGAIEWCYRGNRETPFDTISRGCQQLLPNGNVLITESNNGRLFEVNRNCEIVWEFYSTDRMGKNKDHVPMVYGAQRFTREELPFLNSTTLARSGDDGSHGQ